MVGETSLTTLLRSMSPQLHDQPYGIVLANDAAPFALGNVFATITEDEGVTLVATAAALAQAGYDVPSPWARITLQIHSSLEAVGLTAAFATALGKVGISANVIAGFHHDHIFVQWDKRHTAVAALAALSRSA
jgi:uncharacterized protein